MMSAGPSVDQIMAAIQESGYLMEQDVATSLERRGMHVRTNVAFEDADEGKSRELDVTAVTRVAKADDVKLAAFVEMLVECKNSTNPFVFIARPKNDEDRHKSPREFVFPYKYQMKKDIGEGRVMTREVEAFHHLGYDQVYDAYIRPWKAVQFCRIDRKGAGWSANHGGLYDATFYPMAKALTAKLKALPKGARPEDWKYIWLFFPLVITSGELFLIDSSADNPCPVAVDHVSFVRELKTASLSGSFTVTFVRQSALEVFLSDVIDPMVARSVELIDQCKKFISQTDLPWVE